MGWLIDWLIDQINVKLSACEMFFLIQIICYIGDYLNNWCNIFMLEICNYHDIYVVKKTDNVSSRLLPIH